MLIPKGAHILPAAWWYLHDPEVHANPETFDPERFLGSAPEPDPMLSAFGFGRRICPGRYLADNNLFLNVSQVR
ncbi:cytochrome P450 [Candidatus Bathyarchaeota archaeon]|nr:cytochrome P450 [Candidatus Bathyarchaeota archaeon]